MLPGRKERTAYRWKVEDEEFRKRWYDALTVGAEGLEDEARKRAYNGSDVLLIFLLKGLFPHKYGTARVDAKSDTKVKVKADYGFVMAGELSFTETATLLNAPAKFKKSANSTVPFPSVSAAGRNPTSPSLRP